MPILCSVCDSKLKSSNPEEGLIIEPCKKCLNKTYNIGYNKGQINQINVDILDSGQKKGPNV